MQNSRWPPKVAGKQFFREKSLVDYADTLWVKNLVEIVLFLTVSEINALLPFKQKVKMTAKWRESDFSEKSPVDYADTLWVKNVVEIALSRTVSEINLFLCFTQKFKMAAKNGRKAILGKSCQYTLLIPSGSKILSKSLYLAPFPRY